MEELDLLRKKTGMTIAKAFTLVFSLVLIFGVVSITFGILSNTNRGKIISRDIIENEVFIILLIVFFLGNIWAYFINKKELPFFRKTSFTIIILSIIIAFAWCYIIPIITEFHFFGEKQSKSREHIATNSILTLAISLFFTFLQIGFIGHGLLKNYLFKQAIFTVAAVSIMFFVPEAVIGLAFQSLIMFYVYYRTASFLLPILMTVIFSLVEDCFKLIYGSEIGTVNYVRTHIIQNDTLYFAGLIASVFVILGGLYFIKKETKTIKWQRPDEDESIAFL
jgi:hypothetical protein